MLRQAPWKKQFKCLTYPFELLITLPRWCLFIKKKKKSWQQLHFLFCRTATWILFLMPQRAFFSKGIKEGLGAENVYIVVYLRNRILAVSIPVCTVMELWRKKVFCVCVFFFKLVNMLGILWRLPFRYCDQSQILWWFSCVLYIPDNANWAASYWRLS